MTGLPVVTKRVCSLLSDNICYSLCSFYQQPHAAQHHRTHPQPGGERLPNLFHQTAPPELIVVIPHDTEVVAIQDPTVLTDQRDQGKGHLNQEVPDQLQIIVIHQSIVRPKKEIVVLPYH